jgi:hypothetical protein
MNFLVVSFIYFALSRRLYQLTLFVRGMLLPNDRTACFTNTLVLGAILTAYTALALFLKLLGILCLSTVCIVSALLGMFLYRLIIDTTWLLHVSENRRSSSAVTVFTSKRWSPSSGTLSFSAGTAAIAFLGLCWNSMALFGAGKTQMLSNACEANVQRGFWIPFNGCNGNFRGEAYRDFGAGTLGTCSPQSHQFVWGWEISPSSSHCTIVQRSPESLLKTLGTRNVTFVGDSIVRHLYHALCRQVGDHTAGAYNTTLGKWSDFSRRYGKTDLEFRWAPYLDEMGDILNHIQEGTRTPDVVVLGGGPWDRLHRFNTTKNKQLVLENARTLAQHIEALKAADVGVVWVSPTAINTWGLMTEEKRKNIRDDQIVQLRELFRELGIDDAASFVLDGRSFTHGRVQESYDGVHYPLDVYDAGAQILANSFDWLLPILNASDPLISPRPGSMAQPILGFGIFCFVMVGLFCFDGFLGVSYLAAIVAPELMPSRLYFEAFSTLHHVKKLPTLLGNGIVTEESVLDVSKNAFHSSRRIKSKDSDNVSPVGDISECELQSFLDDDYVEGRESEGSK